MNSFSPSAKKVKVAAIKVHQQYCIASVSLSRHVERPIIKQMADHHDEIWKTLHDKLPWENTPEATAKRDQMWKTIDVNGNGYLSLAEVDKGMRDVAKLPQVFALKPVMMRAFQKTKKSLKSKNPHGDDYVSHAEFSFLLKYLRQIYQYWVAFERIDTDHNRKITVKEFTLALPTLEKWGIKIKDAGKTFHEIDKNGGGQILFDEFTDWAGRINLDLDDDDNAV